MISIIEFNLDYVPLELISKRVKREMLVVPEDSYRTLGCHLYGEGVYQREIKQGFDILAKKMYKVETDDLVVNRIWAQKGSAGVVPYEISGSVVTPDFPVFELNKSKVIPSFVAWYLKSSRFWDECKKHSHGTSGRQRLSPKELPKITFPVCEKKCQKKIIDKLDYFEHHIKKIKSLKNQCNTDIEKYKSSTWHKIMKYEDGYYNQVMLNDVVSINPESKNPSKVMPDSEFFYIDISSVESGTGRILNPMKIFGAGAPSRARRVVYEGNIIMSTVRPYLKSFAIIPKKYDNQICSTGFAVLKCKNKILPKYLLYSLFSDEIIKQCTEMMLGAHYPALRVKQIEQIEILLPKIDEQKQIIILFEKFLQIIETVQSRLIQNDEGINSFMETALNSFFK